MAQCRLRPRQCVSGEIRIRCVVRLLRFDSRFVLSVPVQVVLLIVVLIVGFIGFFQGGLFYGHKGQTDFGGYKSLYRYRK